MSLEAMVAVLHHSAAQGSCKLVLLGLANHEREDGAWCSLATLARYANITVRNARRHIAALVESGELVVIERPGTTSRYRVMVTCPATCDRTSQHRDLSTAPVTTDRGTPVTGDLPTPVKIDRGAESDPGQYRPPTPVTGDRGPRSKLTAEPVKNQSFNHAAADAAAAAAVDNSETGDQADEPPRDPGGGPPGPADAGPALAVAILADRCALAGLVVRWDTLTGPEIAEVAALVEAHGDQVLITAAHNTRAAHATPAVSARAWLPIWRSLPPPGARLAAAPEPRCDLHPTEPARACRSCAADAKAAR